MNYDQLVKKGLQNDGNLKLILGGETVTENNEKKVVTSVLYISDSVSAIEKQLNMLNKNKKNGDFYMVYSCPKDQLLSKLDHYPSIEITTEDFE